MASCKLTNRVITRPLPKTGIVELWDSVVPGLHLRLNAGGRRSFSVTTRLNGKQIRRRIGTTVTHSLAQAREEARDLIRDAHRGVDSRSKIAVQRAQQEATRAEASTFRATAEAWLADEGKGGGANLRSKPEVESRLRRDVYPKIGALALESITRGDLRKLVDGIARKRPVAANRTLGNVRRVFNWAIKKDRLAASPAVGIDPPADETSRDRVLRDREIKKLWGAFEQLGYPFGPAFQMLTLTGARRNEVGGMTWDEIEGDTWHLPSERTKNARPHQVPLSSVALSVLAEVPHMEDSDFLFTTTGDRPSSGWFRAKERASELSGVTDWRLHDLRRTCVTGMAELDIDPHVIEAAVNHISGAARAGVAGIYNRAQYLPQRKAAFEAWGQHVMAVVSDKKAKGNVAEFRRA